MEGILIVFGCLGIALVWRRLLFKGGLTVLAASLTVFIFASLISVEYGVAVLIFVGVLVLIQQVWRKKNLPVYTAAEAAFETSEILRGLTPVEAAYLLRVPARETFCIALITVFDKGFVSVDLRQLNPKIYLKAEYAINEDYISPRDRINFRIKAAFKNKQVLHRYEDTLLELVPAESGIRLSEINYQLWYRAFKDSIREAIRVHDVERTREYASEFMMEKTTSGSVFSQGKRNLSGWYALRIIAKPNYNKITHRPDWLSEDDEFEEIVRLILGQLKN